MLLSCEPDVELVGEAATGRKAIALAMRLCPSIVLMDLAMAQLNGVEATRQIMAASPNIKVIALSSYADLALVRKALAAGAAAYLLKHTSYANLVSAIREVQQGYAYFSPEIARQLSAAWVQAEAEKRSDIKPRMTVREAEILQLVAEGQTSKAIALDLGLSIRTVDKHRQRLMRKLNLHCTADLVRYAVSTRVVEDQAFSDSLVTA
jgi:DNA-binding NarL/FixJ family response regulator